jgi:transposase
LNKGRQSGGALQDKDGTMSTLPNSVLAIDVSKAVLDTAGYPKPWRRQLPNTGAGIGRIIAEAKRRGAMVVFEATSIYDRSLLAALDRSGLPYHRANPRKAREYARAAGFLAKTDLVEAEMLASYAAHIPLRLAEPVAAERAALRTLTDRRDQLVEMRKAEQVRLQQTEPPAIRAELESHIGELTSRIAAYEVEIAAALRQDALANPACWLITAPGVATITAAGLLALLPELGHRSAKTIVALVGLAPLAKDSGRRRGKRAIWGGRPAVRRLLYLAARHAARHPAFKVFAARLAAAGKPPKVVLIAVARKLLIILNLKLQQQRPFRDAIA